MIGIDVSGLRRGSRVGVGVLGHRGMRLVVDATAAVESVVDGRTGLPFCRIEDVFEPDAVFLGFGAPNVFLMVPEPDGRNWRKFTAFMFYRQNSYVAQRMDRMQVGIYFELCNLPASAIDALRREMDAQQGRRTASCAHANARILAAAGFTSGGRSIAKIYRPSHLAAHIWDHGLEYRATPQSQAVPVELRFFQAGSEVGDHFVGVWKKEVTSACRTIRRMWFSGKHTQAAAPQFEASESAGMPIERWTESKDAVTIGVSRPSWLGVWFGFLLGQRPIFSLQLGEPLGQELGASLVRFPGKLDFVTKLKKHILFSGPVVRYLRRRLMKSVDTQCVPRRAVVEMLRRSPGADREGAFVYNVVLTPDKIHLARLENRNGRDRRVVNWILAKHLVVGGYDADVRFAGEAWCFEDNGKLVVVLTGDSGTYKPSNEQLVAASKLISGLLDAPVTVQQR